MLAGCLRMLAGAYVDNYASKNILLHAWHRHNICQIQSLALDLLSQDAPFLFLVEFSKVKCPIRGDRTLDNVYSNIKHVYIATPFPDLEQSLCSSSLPTQPSGNRPLQEPGSLKHDDALLQPQDCFGLTD